MTLSAFSPSIPGGTGNPRDNTNGSFSGFGPDMLDNNGMGYGEINVTNDFRTYSLLMALGMPSSDPVYVKPVPQNALVQGFTFNDSQKAYVNYTMSAVVDPEDALGTQIYELGNSLAVITSGPIQNKLQSEKNDPGARTLDCYNTLSGSHLFQE